MLQNVPVVGWKVPGGDYKVADYVPPPPKGPRGQGGRKLDLIDR